MQCTPQTNKIKCNYKLSYLRVHFLGSVYTSNMSFSTVLINCPMPHWTNSVASRHTTNQVAVLDIQSISNLKLLI